MKKRSEEMRGEENSMPDFKNRHNLQTGSGVYARYLEFGLRELCASYLGRFVACLTAFIFSVVALKLRRKIVFLFFFLSRLRLD